MNKHAFLIAAILGVAVTILTSSSVWGCFAIVAIIILFEVNDSHWSLK